VAKIVFDSHEDADLFAAAVALLTDGGTVPAAPAKPAAKKAAPAAEPEPEDEPDEDLLGGGDDEPTVQDALDIASAKVQDGKAVAVKKILTDLGVKKVSELDGNVDGIKTFIAKASAV
jgi:hypothetical protein